MGNSDHGTTYMRVGEDDGELRPWHYIYVYNQKRGGERPARALPFAEFATAAHPPHRPASKINERVGPGNKTNLFPKLDAPSQGIA